MSFLQRLGEDPIIAVISLAVGVIGAALAVVFYLKGRRFKALTFAVVQHPLIENLKAALDGLDITYKGVTCERITVSRVAIWNAGSQTIDTSDLTAVDPLGIAIAPGADVLDARVVRSPEPANQFECDPSVKPISEGAAFVAISFDYLDPGDGGIVQIVHTGSVGQRTRLQGKVKGAGRISYRGALLSKLAGITVERAAFPS